MTATFITIRPVEPEDANAWAALRNELWQGNDHLEEIAAFFAGQLQEPAAVFVAVREGEKEELVGFAEISLRHDYVDGASTSPVAYLEGWFVSSAYRRQKVGRQLIQAAEQWALQRGITEFASDAELDNSASHAAHEACGFEESAQLIHYIKKLQQG